MQLSTRLHDAADGKIVGNVSALDFGSVAPGTFSPTLVLSLHVGQVASISNIVFEVLPSKSADLDNGVLKWSKALIFEPKSELEAAFASDRRSVELRNLDSTTSELIYLQLDTSKPGLDAEGTFWFRWSFDYVDASSSSSSSSSNNFGDCALIVTDDIYEQTLAEGDCVCYRLTIDSTEYATIVMNGSNIEVANVGDSLELNSNALVLYDTVGLYLDGTWYSVFLNYASDHEFVILMCNIGASSSSSSLAPNILFELDTMTNSSSSSSWSSSFSSSSSGA